LQSILWPTFRFYRGRYRLDKADAVLKIFFVEISVRQGLHTLPLSSLHQDDGHEAYFTGESSWVVDAIRAQHILANVMHALA
jgi:hypothetical protein